MSSARCLSYDWLSFQCVVCHSISHCYTRTSITFRNTTGDVTTSLLFSMKALLSSGSIKSRIVDAQPKYPLWSLSFAPLIAVLLQNPRWMGCLTKGPSLIVQNPMVLQRLSCNCLPFHPILLTSQFHQDSPVPYLASNFVSIFHIWFTNLSSCHHLFAFCQLRLLYCTSIYFSLSNQNCICGRDEYVTLSNTRAYDVIASVPSFSLLSFTSLKRP